MVGAPSAREEEQARLAGARTEFVASLPRRLEVLRAALAALEEAPQERSRQHGMLRRIHALGSAARVLGFATVAEVLAEAERAVGRASRPGNQTLAFQDVARALDLLPSLVLGAPAAPRPLGSDVDARAVERAYPLSVLLFGTETLAQALAGEEPDRLDLERTEDLGRAREIARSVGPDVAVIDGDLRDAKELAELLLSDPQIERVPLLVIGAFVSPEAATAYVTLGADRVLPKPVSPETLRRTVFELHDLASRPRPTREPVGELTVDALADRIAQEVRKGLVESVEVGGQSTPVDFGDGADVLAAVWGAVARVRELVTVRSRGNVRFQPSGPEGAIPLAPLSDDRRAGDRAGRYARGAEDVALRNRRVLVADDDPAVVWFMTSLFKSVGAEVLEAHDGERALERVFEIAPDLVVSDVLMPGRDGFALCHEIKRDVVARDIPVILLSWKEDLLQRVRELGADADGYLRKEAAASTVVERVREVLRPRARIEQRLAAGGPARGRLDGITPRFVLDRVCRSAPDSTLTIRDAVYLYEIHVRGGRVQTATRTATDGSFERGDRVLASLLGVSAGRFAVEPDTSPCRSDFNEALPALLARHIERARAALAAVSAERLSRVVRIGIDREAVRGYLECTPDSVRQLLERVADGASPRELLVAGDASPRLLESVLSDLARRGAILTVENDDGPALTLQPIPPRPRTIAPAAAATAATSARTATATAPTATAAAPAATTESLDTDWPSTPPPPLGSDTKASPERVSDASAAAPGSVQPLTAPLGSLALEGSQGSAASEEGEGWFRFQVEPSAPAGLPPVAPVAQEPKPPAAASSGAGRAPSADELSPESLSIFAALTDEIVLPSGDRPKSADAGVDAPGSDAEVPAATSDLGDASADADEPIVPASDDCDLAGEPGAPQTLGGLGPPPPVADPARNLSQTLPFGSTMPHSGPRPALRMPETKTPSPGMADVIAAVVAHGEAPPTDTAGQAAEAGAQGSEPPGTRVSAPVTQILGSPATARAPAPKAAPADDEEPDIFAALTEEPAETKASETAAREAAPREAPDPPADDPAEAAPATEAPVQTPPTIELSGESAAPVAQEPESAEAAAKPPSSDPPPAAPEPAPPAAALDATLVSEGAPPERDASSGDVVLQPRNATPRSAAGSKPSSQSRAEPAPRSDDPGLLRTAFLALLAFAAAFGVVRYAIVPMLEPKEAPATGPTPTIADRPAPGTAR